MRYLLPVLVLAACKTTLGPMPATTGVAAMPASVASAEVQGGVVPGYNLSQSAAEKQNGAPIGQLALAIDPGRVVPGAVVGARIFGPKGDTLFEPMVGYRRAIGGRMALGVFGFATQGSATVQDASYSATRAGGELALDVRLLDQNHWAEPHVLLSTSVTGISADGEYCQDDTHMHGVDCPDTGPTNQVAANVSGAYPAATLGIGIDLLRHRDSYFRGARLEGLAGAGLMPRVIAGQQESAAAYFTIGLAFSVSAGFSR